MDRPCKVTFKLGPYNDEFDCAVVPMDVCHIFLSRPWQFDRRTTHNGFDNT